MRTIARCELATELNCEAPGGGVGPTARSIAQFMRDALGRWGLCPRRALYRHARDQLRAGDFSTDDVPLVLKRLVALGECEEVLVGHEVYVAPAERRWVASGMGVAVLLGATVVPSSIPRVAPLDRSDVAVRLGFRNEEDAATLVTCGAREVSLAEWLYRPDFLRHAARRVRGAIRHDQCNLVAFWELLVEAIGAEGLPLSADADIRAVVGEAGGFFGRYSAPTPEGRWKKEVPDGIWCAYRRGHGEGHWLPTLISKEGEERQALDLFDDDEWRWALLARSWAVGPREDLQKTGEDWIAPWPLPAQLRAAMDIVGMPSGVWRWRLAGDATDLWNLLK